METFWKSSGGGAGRHDPERVPDGTLCTTCWTGTPCRHTTTEELEPERYQPHNLCVLCCRAWAPLRSRWSWLACHECRRMNARIGGSFGREVQLPLGRHSIMNGAGINLNQIDPLVREAQKERLIMLGGGWQRLFEWRRLEARRLQRALLPPDHADAEFVPTEVWRGHVPHGYRYSCQAWLACRGLQSFAELGQQVHLFCELGVMPWPDRMPGPQWWP